VADVFFFSFGDAILDASRSLLDLSKLFDVCFVLAILS